ncbi:BRO1 Vacuolar protein-sorting protein BRO1 [Candida maltosa Xu316]
MKTHLLVIPSKKTEEVNWIKPLNNYLLSIYGNTSQYQDDLNSLNKLRQDIRGVNADNTGLRLYYTYYSQLELIDLRIPFHEVNKSKKLEFEWYDSFSGLAHSQTALPFEKANVLFNIGALLSKFANSKYNESQNSDGEKSFKDSVLMLQQAAGIFQFINENFLHAPSDDLAQSTIKFLSKLMVAQSQEIFSLKVITGDLNQSKNSLIAKLCKSSSILYEDCYNMINQDRKNQNFKYVDYEGDDGGNDDDDDYSSEGFLERPEDTDDSDTRYVAAELDSSWIATIYFKYQYYKSLAFYYQGLQLEAGRKYGEAIAYLTKSKDVLNEIHSSTLKSISKGSGDVYEILDNYKYQKDVVAIKLTDLNKDNDLIYHDIVPSLVTLPEIKPMDSTKVIQLSDNTVFHEVNEKNYSNFLVNVVPINIHELSSYYSEEKSKYLRTEIDHFEVSNEEVVSALEYFDLPKSLVQIKESLRGQSDESLSSDIIRKVQEISSNYQQDVANKASIENLKKEIYQSISFLDQNNRKDDAIQLKKVLYDAASSDNKLSSLIDEKYHAILGKGVNSPDFKKLFDVSSQGPEVSLLDMDDTQDKQIKAIEDILNDLNTIKSNKAKLIDKLKKEIHSDDISDILVLNMKLKSSNEIKSVIFPEELKKFSGFSIELDKLIRNEKSFISELKNQWGQLTSNPEIKRIQNSKNSKNQLIANESIKIDQFYENWVKYHSGLSKGESFYKGLLNHCQNLKNSVDELEKQMRSMSFKNDQYQGVSGGYQQPQVPGSYQQPQVSGGYQNLQRTGSYQQQQPQISGGYQQPQQQQQQFLFPQSQLQPYEQRNIPQSGYGRPPPQLPPKQPTNFNNFPQQQQQQQPPPQQQSQWDNRGNAPPWQPTQNKTGSQSNLIYDNPSTYNPDMYNFFSNK